MRGQPAVECWLPTSHQNAGKVRSVYVVDHYSNSCPYTVLSTYIHTQCSHLAFPSNMLFTRVRVSCLGPFPGDFEGVVRRPPNTRSRLSDFDRFSSTRPSPNVFTPFSSTPASTFARRCHRHEDLALHAFTCSLWVGAVNAAQVCNALSPPSALRCSSPPTLHSHTRHRLRTISVHSFSTTQPGGSTSLPNSAPSSESGAVVRTKGWRRH